MWRIFFFGEKIYIFLKVFTDSRDFDVLIISYFFLLLGCVIFVWLSLMIFKDRLLVVYVGILSLGIGDIMVFVVGYNFGFM